MKVLALNSSPRTGDQSKTELMLNNLVAGMRDAGAEVEVVNLRKKRINKCIGCYTCWTKTPGVCIHKDDMAEELFHKWHGADLVIYATPLYNYTMTADMKVFIERTLPGIEPFFKINAGRMYHPFRGKCPAAAVLSVSGMPDRGHFDALSALMNYLFSSPGRWLIAEIYRPAAEIMVNPLLEETARGILEATRQAGRELVQSSTISPATMEKITRPIMADEDFLSVANVMWKSCIAERVTPKEFGRKKLVPRPDSLESFMSILSLGLDPSLVSDRSVVLQFRFSGEVKGACYFSLDRGGVKAQSGARDGADVTIDAPFETWVDIMTGKLDGQQAFMEQKYTVTGDLNLMLKLFQKSGTTS